MSFSNDYRKFGKIKIRFMAFLCIATLASVSSSCGSSGEAGGDTTIPIETLKTELAAGLENVYTTLESADHKSSKAGDGILDADDVSTALLNENLFSKVDVVVDQGGFFFSRNLCKGQGYDSLLKGLKPTKTIFSTAFEPQNVRENKSPDYVVMNVQLSVFPSVMDTELINLYKNFSDTVTSVGSTCESTFRNGLTSQCDWSKIKSSAPNWWNEDDLKGLGCELGNEKFEVTSKVSKLDFTFFNFPFLLSQISSKDRGRILARSVVVLPQRTLKTVFVLEVTAVRNGAVTSSSDVPSLRDVASNATNVAATLTNSWIEIINKELNLASLIAQDVVISEIEG